MNQRAHPRFPIAFPVVITLERKGTKPVEVRAVASSDISIAGLGVTLETEAAVAMGERVGVALRLLDDGGDLMEVVFRAEVMWKKPGKCGLKIAEIDAPNRALYETLVATFGSGNS